MKTLLILFLMLALNCKAAVVYLRSTDGNDADDGTTWALAKATFINALASMNATVTNTLYISQSHFEITNGAATYTLPGTAASPTYIICGNDGAEPPTALATTAIIATSGASSMNFLGNGYVYGVNFHHATNSSGYSTINLNSLATAVSYLKFDSCRFEDKALNANPHFLLGAPNYARLASYTEFENTVCTVSNAGAGFFIAGNFAWKNTVAAIQGAIVPTTLFTDFTGVDPDVIVNNVDLSALGSGNLVNIAAATSARYVFNNCKLGASAVITTGTHATSAGAEVRLVNCDSANTVYRYVKRMYQGTETSDTAVKRLATDGTTRFSRKIVTGSGPNWFAPFVTDPMLWWNTTIGTIAITNFFISEGIVSSNNNVWLDVDFLGTNGLPLGTNTSTRNAGILTAGAANPVDTGSAWTTNGIVVPITNYVTVSITPQQIGFIRARLNVAKTNCAIWYDPIIVGSSAAQYLSSEGVINAPVSSGSAANISCPIFRR